jgi:hypothetical protein
MIHSFTQDFSLKIEFQKNEMLVFPPGGFSTFDEVCTALLVFPALILSEALDGSGQLVLRGCCCSWGGGAGV